MINLRRLVPVLTGILVATGAWGVSAVGCSSNGGSPGGGPPDATADSEADGQADGQVDTGSGADAPADTQADTFVVQPDTGAADSQAGDSGASDADSGPDANPAVDFPQVLAAALCNNVAACCGTTGDAATFNWQSCVTAFYAQGDFKGNTLGQYVIPNGNVVFNPVQAQACLTAIQAVDCVANQVTATEETQLFQSCFAALEGTLPTGAPCAATLECAPGNFCMPVDGGAGDGGQIGLCQGLAGVGGACGMFGLNQALGQTACSYRGSGSDGLFCQNVAADAATTQLPSSEWTCQPQWANGSGCWAAQDCSSFVCYSDTCASAGNWYNPASCSFWYVDAGGD